MIDLMRFYYGYSYGEAADAEPNGNHATYLTVGERLRLTWSDWGGEEPDADWAYPPKALGYTMHFEAGLNKVCADAIITAVKRELTARKIPLLSVHVRNLRFESPNEHAETFITFKVPLETQRALERIIVRLNRPHRRYAPWQDFKVEVPEEAATPAILAARPARAAHVEAHYPLISAEPTPDAPTVQPGQHRKYVQVIARQ